MPYYYSDPERGGETGTLPNIEVFYAQVVYSKCCRTPHYKYTGCDLQPCITCDKDTEFIPITSKEGNYG